MIKADLLLNWKAKLKWMQTSIRFQLQYSGTSLKPAQTTTLSVQCKNKKVMVKRNSKNKGKQWNSELQPRDMCRKPLRLRLGSVRLALALMRRISEEGLGFWDCFLLVQFHSRLLCVEEVKAVIYEKTTRKKQEKTYTVKNNFICSTRTFLHKNVLFISKVICCLCNHLWNLAAIS